MRKKYQLQLLCIISILLVVACATDDNATSKNFNSQNFSRATNPITDNSPVQIGNQIWTTKNLNVTRYRNGDIIPQVQDPNLWSNLTSGAWCYYGNSTANGIIYGKLYNWYAVNDTRGLAPQGWHIPSDSEIVTLMTFLGGGTNAGGPMKATVLWNIPNVGATNSSGFTGFPGGNRRDDGQFANINISGIWWNSNSVVSTQAKNFSLAWSNGYLSRQSNHKRYGISVRCIKD